MFLALEIEENEEVEEEKEKVHEEKESIVVRTDDTVGKLTDSKSTNSEISRKYVL